MLTETENRFNIGLIKAFAFMKLYPFKVSTGKDAKGKLEFKLGAKTGVLAIWRLALILCAAFSLFASGRLCQALVRKELKIRDSIWLLVEALSACIAWWAYMHFCQYPGCATGILNAVYARVEVGTGRPRKLWQLKRQEIITKYFGMMCLVDIIILGVILAVDGGVIQVVYGSLLQGPLSYAAGVTLPAFNLCYITHVYFLVVLSHIMLFEMSIAFLSDEKRKLEKKSSSVSYPKLLAICKNLRLLQVLAGQFDSANRHIIYSHKIICLSLGIMSGYLFIRLGQRNPDLGLVSLMMFLTSTAFYALFYEKAFRIPEDVEGLKKLILRVTLGNALCREQVSHISRLVKSIPAVAIHVGSFHKMERESTLLFLDFLVTNLVSLLLTYYWLAKSLLYLMCRMEQMFVNSST